MAIPFKSNITVQKISGLTNLNGLSFGNTTIQGLTEVSGLTKLNNLTIGNTTISGATKITSTDFDGTVTMVAREQGTVDASRCVWFSDSAEPKKLNFDEKFKYNPNTGILQANRLMGSADYPTGFGGYSTTNDWGYGQAHGHKLKTRWNTGDGGAINFRKNSNNQLDVEINGRLYIKDGMEKAIVWSDVNHIFTSTLSPVHNCSEDAKTGTHTWEIDISDNRKQRLVSVIGSGWLSAEYGDSHNNNLDRNDVIPRFCGATATYNDDTGIIKVSCNWERNKTTPRWTYKMQYIAYFISID